MEPQEILFGLGEHSSNEEIREKAFDLIGRIRFIPSATVNRGRPECRILDYHRLEVSSPGINRKLTRPEHFEAFLEAPVRVKLIRPLENGVRELEGILIDVAENGDFEVITEEDTTVTFTRKECASVNLIEDYD